VKLAVGDSELVRRGGNDATSTVGSGWGQRGQSGGRRRAGGSSQSGGRRVSCVPRPHGCVIVGPFPKLSETT
jgi:hypothetical protein